MLNVQNRGSALLIMSNAKTSGFSFSVEPVTKGQTIDVGYVDDNGESRMVILTVLAVKKYQIDGSNGAIDVYSNISLEAEILRHADSGYTETAKKFNFTLEKDAQPFQFDTIV